VKQITESVWLHQDTCNVYVVKNGRDAVLIDFGDGSVLDRLDEAGVHRVTDILMTHHHRDQGQGLHRAVAAGARIWVPHTEQDLFHSVDVHWQAREIYNSYNNREDRFSLLASVPVEGTLRDYGQYWFEDRAFTVVPTPGHTIGSITLLTEADGQRLAFTGDLIYSAGKVWSLAATQWSYNGGEGIAGSILSLLDLKERQPDLLLPSHGEPMGPEAIDPTVQGLADLRTLRRQNPRLFLLRETPFERVTPHLLKNRTSMSDAYILLSESGKALAIDFGYDFMFGPAAGADRASRRPWLYNLPALKRGFGVSNIDVVLPTHYHDDHVAGLNLLRDVEGTQVWAPFLFADVLERPSRYDLPCLWYDPIPVDRRLPLGEPVQWEEYTLTLYPLSGHTYYAVAIAFEVDGKKVVAVGDQQESDLKLNYVYKNGFRIHDYVDTAELYHTLQPDLFLTGHWGAHEVTPAWLASLTERGADLERFHQELLPPAVVAGDGVRIRPYQSTVHAGGHAHLEVLVRNPFNRPEEAEVRLALPPGWTAEPLVATAMLPENGSSVISFTVMPPHGLTARRVPVAADLTVGGRRFGQQAEALITVHQGEE
jgi:glyoxylase-like metal-dependent hydrolase (beta-lactamase superfamily II)